MTRRVQYLLLPLALCLCAFLAAPAAAQQTASADLIVENRADTDSEIQPPARRRVHAKRCVSNPSIDARLDEAAWQDAPVIDGFKQREPDQGADPTERTEVRVLYDDEALYIGARMYDSSPDSIIARLGRRDSYLEADAFGFFIDSYLDRRTGFYFAINAAGTLMDGVLMNDDWDDDSWDGVWQGKARIVEDGWIAEMRIPYSQLRFKKQDSYTWGINFRRDIARKNEQQFLVYTPRNESGFVSRFVEMVGIEGITPPRQMELVPYVTTRAAFTEARDGDPFNDGSEFTPDVGADFKVGITSNLTLNGTVNPDFGQVEVDPAVVNLSDRETFFPEKRAFFIEGASVFNFGRGGSNSNWSFNYSNPNFFYSRRIGRPPQGSLPNHDFAERPAPGRILGATKLTGKIGEGWNVGTVQAVTGRSMADYQFDGQRLRAEVEPAAYYGVFRAQREFNDGHRALGFMSTTAVRDFKEDRLRDEINSSAYTFGLDGWTFLDSERTWVFTGWLGGTHVRGNEARITRLQRSSQHYFQRPDFESASLDSSATSLSGTAGRFMLNKQRGRFSFNSAIGFISPGFDANDLGFQWKTNVINGHIAGGYRWTEPKGIYRRINVNASIFRTMDFDGNALTMGYWANTWMQFKNYYSLWGGGSILPHETLDNSATRGGPLMLNLPGFEFFGGVETDERKPWVFEVGGFGYYSDESKSSSIWTEIEWTPAANVAVEVEPRVSVNKRQAQYVGTFEDATATNTFGHRYVFGELDQTTFSAGIRLNWTFTPLMSLQLYAQPLISSGDYSRLKELARPRSFDFNVYGEDNGSTFDEGDGENFIADPDGDGPAAPLALSNPDFNFKSLRGTAVLRWEFRPGSTLFLVWTQTRDHFEETGRFQFRQNFDTLLDAKPDNIFMLKFTYWLSR